MPLSIDHRIGLLFVLGGVACFGLAWRVCRVSPMALLSGDDPPDPKRRRCPMRLSLLVLATGLVAVATAAGDAESRAVWLPVSFLAGYSAVFALFLWMRR